MFVLIHIALTSRVILENPFGGLPENVFDKTHPLPARATVRERDRNMLPRLTGEPELFPPLPIGSDHREGITGGAGDPESTEQTAGITPHFPGGDPVGLIAFLEFLSHGFTCLSRNPRALRTSGSRAGLSFLQLIHTLTMQSE